jgi:hypothetical protein
MDPMNPKTLDSLGLSPQLITLEESYMNLNNGRCFVVVSEPFEPKWDWHYFSWRSSFEVGSFEVGSFEVGSFEVSSFEVSSC